MAKTTKVARARFWRKTNLPLLIESFNDLVVGDTLFDLPYTTYINMALDRRELGLKVQEYENFINDKLQVDLEIVLKAREGILEEITQYEQLQAQLQLLKSQNLQEIDTLLDLGHNFYMKAVVPDTYYVYVKIGYGFHVQLTHDEARSFIEKKCRQLKQKSKALTDKASTIRTHIRAMLHVINDIVTITAYS